MSIAAFSLVLVAAALHASWNAIVKSAADTRLTMVLVTASAALASALVLPVLAPPAVASWPLIAVSAIIHIAYFSLVAGAYRVADMSQAYPLMRGTAPLIVALVSVVWLGDPLPAEAWLGIAAISAGILAMTGDLRGGRGAAGARLALANAGIIAAYTVLDGIGARRSGAPAAYALWVFLLTGVPLAAWAIHTGASQVRAYIADNWRLGLVGGIGTVSSYALVLHAMTIAPIAVVAALRETSIVFGTAISGLLLKERVGPARLVAVCVIATGTALLRLA